MTGTGQLWTEERHARMMELVAEGLSSALIAKQLGVSRNAVIGRLFRAGVKRKPPREVVPHGNLSLTKRNAAVSTAPVETLDRPTVWGVHQEPAPLPDAPPPPDRKSSGITMLEARAGQCRWVYDDKTICAAAVKKGTSWCPEHYSIVYRPVPSRKTQLPH